MTRIALTLSALFATLLVSSTAQAQFGWNPVIDVSPTQTSVFHNPFHNSTHVHDSTHHTHASALDPFREHIAPGSMRYVNRTFYQNGVLYRQTGYTWRNAVNGRPHSRLTTTRVVHYHNQFGGPSLTHSNSTISHRNAGRSQMQGGHSQNTHSSSITTHAVPGPGRSR